jgi:hypothetical protein
VKCFSDVEDTAKLLVNRLAPKVDALCYRPGAEAIISEGSRRLVNTYRAPRLVEDAKGDARPFIRYICHLIPNRKERRMLLRWLATLYVYPEIHMSYGVLLISETQGTGKTTFCDIAARLVGINNTSFPTEDQIMSQFNSWLVHKRLIVIGECYTGHSRAAYNKLKICVDANTMARLMFTPPYWIELYCHVAACSNSKRALYLDNMDRRWLVPPVTEEIRTKEYWSSFHSWLDAGGINIIAAYLKRFLKKQDPVKRGELAPMTVAKEEVIIESQSDGQRMAYELAKKAIDLKTPDKEKKKVVLRIKEVREWIANRRGMQIGFNDQNLESAYTIRRVMVGAGLSEPNRTREGRKPRIVIDHRPEYVVANFEIEAGATWEEDLKEHHLAPDDVGPI